MTNVPSHIVYTYVHVHCTCVMYVNMYVYVHNVCVQRLVKLMLIYTTYMFSLAAAVRCWKGKATQHNTDPKEVF